jgi:hypothetical protein
MNATATAARVTPQNTLMLDRWAARTPFPRWAIVVAFGIFLLILPAALGYLEQVPRLFTDYRAQFVYPFLIVYLLAAGPLVQATREEVAQALRPLIQIDDAEFQTLVDRACSVHPAAELLWFAVGMAVGLTINVFFEPLEADPHLLEIYAYLSRIALFGVFGWAIFVLFATTRLTDVLLRRPLQVDLFDIRPFEPIGRQSLWLALIIIGGILISLFSVSYHNRFLWIEYVITYSGAIVLAVLVFFLNMRGAHRLLAAAKRGQLAFVDRALADAYRRLRAQIAGGLDTLAPATQIHAMAALKQELRAARTWPYNTEMLRTLFISVLMPLFVALARLVPLLLNAADLQLWR